jgi:hypothetical protein
LVSFGGAWSLSPVLTTAGLFAIQRCRRWVWNEVDLQNSTGVSGNFREMTERFKAGLLALWEAIDHDAAIAKSPQEATEEFAEFYAKLNAEERAQADEAIAEWVLSENKRQRFDALTMVRRFKIAAALPNLKRLLFNLASSSTAESRYDFGYVSSLIQLLEMREPH